MTSLRNPKKLIFNHLKNVNHKKLVKPVLTIGYDIAEEDHKEGYDKVVDALHIPRGGVPNRPDEEDALEHLLHLLMRSFENLY